jgi:hypothetical protein
MEPYSTAIFGSIGLGLQAASFFGGQGSADAYNEEQKQQIQLQKQVEAQRRQAMELDASRKQRENIRQVQRARSVALTNATSQGAAQGSGLQGGYGQIQGQGAWNALGISQNLQIGRNIFDLNAQISDSKIRMADAQRDQQFWQGLGSLGSSMTSAAGGFGKLGSGFGGGKPGGPSMTGANALAGWA